MRTRAQKPIELFLIHPFRFKQYFYRKYHTLGLLKGLAKFRATVACIYHELAKGG